MGDQGKQQYTELELLKMQMNKVADESLESTRRMVTSCDTTQRLGSETMQNLHHQGEQLRGIDRNLDTINDTMNETDKDLNKLYKGRSLFGRFKRQPKGFKTDAFNSPKGQSSPSSTAPTGHGGHSKKRQGQPATSQQPAGAYQGRYITPILNDAREQEMEDNLHQVSKMLGQINNMAVDINQELTAQNQVLDRIGTKVEANQAHINVAQRRADNYLGKASKPESSSMSQKFGAAAAEAMFK